MRHTVEPGRRVCRRLTEHPLKRSAAEKPPKQPALCLHQQAREVIDNEARSRSISPMIMDCLDQRVPSRSRDPRQGCLCRPVTVVLHCLWGGAT